MEQTNLTTIFDGTFLAEILNFNGNFAEVAPTDDELMGEEEVGEMNDLEKAIFTVSQKKKEESDGLAESICGKKLEEMNDDGELDFYTELIRRKSTPEQLRKFLSLRAEYTCISKIMWVLIRNRIPLTKEGSTASLRPGWKIVNGMDKESMIEKLFDVVPFGLRKMTRR